MDSNLLKKIIFIYFIESLLKMIKDAFCFMLKALFVFETLTFVLTFWLGRKPLDIKAMVNFKIYNVTDGQQIITIHIAPNISRRKGKQTIKRGELIEYNNTHFS